MSVPKDTPPTYSEAMNQQPPPAGWAVNATAPPGGAPMVHVPHPPSRPYSSVVHITQPAPANTHLVVMRGNCPSCRIGFLQESPTVLGIICCIFFFPLGIICLLTMKERRCPHCGFSFG